MARPRQKPDPVVAPSSVDAGRESVASRPRRRGRPTGSAKEPGSAVTTWLKPVEHDYLIRLAKERDQSISSLVRSLLMLRPR